MDGWGLSAASFWGKDSDNSFGDTSFGDQEQEERFVPTVASSQNDLTLPLVRGAQRIESGPQTVCQTFSLAASSRVARDGEYPFLSPSRERSLIAERLSPLSRPLARIFGPGDRFAGSDSFSSKKSESSSKKDLASVSEDADSSKKDLESGSADGTQSAAYDLESLPSWYSPTRSERNAQEYSRVGRNTEPASVAKDAEPLQKSPSDTKKSAPIKKFKSAVTAVVAAKRVRRLKTHHVHCLQLSAARLACSWVLKIVILNFVIQSFFLIGPLSMPFWIPINPNKACEKASDPGEGPKPLSHREDLKNVKACQKACQELSNCQAVDWYNETHWCNFYRMPCEAPTATWDDPSSWQLAVGCKMQNGTVGVLIGGKCVLGIELPDSWNIIVSEVPKLLLSWWSWAISLGVTCIFLYFKSPWFRGKIKPAVNAGTYVFKPIIGTMKCLWRWFQSGGCYRRALFVLLFMVAWFGATVWYFGPPPTTIEQCKELSVKEYAWTAVSFVVLLLVMCKGWRSAVLSCVIAIGTFLMNAFMGCASFAMSACFDMTAMGTVGAAEVGGGAAIAGAEVAGGAGLLGTAAVAGGEAVAVADGAAAAGAAADAGAAAGGVAVADGAAAAAAAGEGAAAAEAAATAAAVAEATAVAEGASIFFLCAIQ